MKRTASLVLAVLAGASLLAVCAGVANASQVVVREAGNRLVAIPAAGGKPVLLARAARGSIVGTSASANGRVVAFTSRTSGKTAGGPTMTDRVWVMRAGQRPRLVRTFVSVGVDRQFNPVNAVSLSPNGRRLLITKRGGSILGMNVSGGDAYTVDIAGFRVAIGAHPNGSGAKFTPDGRNIVAAFERITSEGPDCGIGIVSAGGGKVRFLRTGRQFGGASRYTAPALSADGRFVAFLERLRDRERLLVMRRDGSGAHEIARSLQGDWRLANPSFSPSGQSLAFAADRVFSGGVVTGRSPSRIFTVRRSGGHLRLLQAERSHRYFRNPAWVG